MKIQFSQGWIQQKCWVFLLATGLFAPCVSQADLAAGARLGTLGVGVDIAKRLDERFNLRVVFSGFQFEYESTENDIDYDFELDIGATGLLFDWHPFTGGMRVTGGVYSNSTKLTGLATPVGNYGIGGTNYNPTDIGDLKAEMDLGSTAPYIGMGWGYNFADSGFGFLLDVGLLVQSSPEVLLTVSKQDSLPISIDAEALAVDLKVEAEELAESLESFELYPVFTIGLSYVF